VTMAENPHYMVLLKSDINKFLLRLYTGWQTRHDDGGGTSGADWANVFPIFQQKLVSGLKRITIIYPPVASLGILISTWKKSSQNLTTKCSHQNCSTVVQKETQGNTKYNYFWN
jgi:hypothetical protein